MGGQLGLHIESLSQQNSHKIAPRKRAVISEAITCCDVVISQLRFSYVNRSSNDI